MKAIITEPEFRGWFRQVVFAVYSRAGAVGETNFGIFRDVFEGVSV